MKCIVIKGKLYTKYTSDALFDVKNRVIVSLEEAIKGLPKNEVKQILKRIKK